MFIVVFLVDTTVFSHYKENEIWTRTIFCETNTAVVSTLGAYKIIRPCTGDKYHHSLQLTISLIASLKAVQVLPVWYS